MRVSLFAMCAFLSLDVSAGERCIAIDGDTLVCNHEKVRLTNVYAAELNQPGGREAKRRLQMFIASGDIALRQLGHDRYGRSLAEVYVNGRRIEQSDIGPRSGRGAQAGGDRHHHIRIRTARMAQRRRASSGVEKNSGVSCYFLRFRRFGATQKLRFDNKHL